MNSRRGFTLVELLVVIAIIGILVALLLPAVQAAREAARRLQCSNNLKQIGIGLHNYLDTHKRFPPSRVRWGSPRITHGWCILAMPFMEMDALHDQYNFNVNWHDPLNEPVTQTVVDLFSCPSTPGGPQLIENTAWGATTKSMTGDYVALAGYWDNVQITPSGGNGMLHDSNGRPRDIRDGLTNTFCISELAGRPDFWTKGKKHATFPAPYVKEWGVWGAAQRIFYVGYTYDGMMNKGPCAVNCSNAEGIYSFHPGGACMLMGDASVQFLREGVPVQNAYRMIDVADGNVVPSPF